MAWLGGYLIGVVLIGGLAAIVSERLAAVAVAVWTVLFVAWAAPWLFAVVAILVVLVVVVAVWLGRKQDAPHRGSPPAPVAPYPTGSASGGSTYPYGRTSVAASAARPVAKVSATDVATPSRPRAAKTAVPATGAAAGPSAALSSKAEVLVAKLADPKRRRACQTELRRMGRPAVDPLVKALGNESLRPFAAVVLVELGPLAEPQLRTAALHGSESFRRTAAQTLDRMGR